MCEAWSANPPTSGRSATRRYPPLARLVMMTWSRPLLKDCVSSKSTDRVGWPSVRLKEASRDLGQLDGSGWVAREWASAEAGGALMTCAHVVSQDSSATCPARPGSAARYTHSPSSFPSHSPGLRPRRAKRPRHRPCRWPTPFQATCRPRR